MGNMYDNLGDFLNEALEKGKIPESKTKYYDSTKNEQYNSPSQTEMQITIDDLPASTKKAFITLDCLPSMPLEEIKKQYRNLIKQNHPDTKEIPKINVAVQDLVSAMEEIEKYYSSTSSPNLR